MDTSFPNQAVDSTTTVDDNGSFAEQIQALYIDENFPGSGQGISSFYRSLKDSGKLQGHSLDDIKEILMKSPAYVTRIPARIHFPRRNIDKLGVGLQTQGDLGFLPPTPRGVNYFLLVVDIFSQFIYVKCLADKKATTTAKAFADILDENPFPLGANIQSFGSDYGTEFQGAFAQLLRERNIKQFAYRGLSKASYAELSIRHVKAKLLAILRGKVSNEWDTMLQPVVDTLNRTYNSAIERTPEQANSVISEEAVRQSLARNVERRNRATAKKYRRQKEKEFPVGSYVYADYKRSGLNSKESDYQRGQVSTLYYRYASVCY